MSFKTLLNREHKVKTCINISILSYVSQSYVDTCQNTKLDSLNRNIDTLNRSIAVNKVQTDQFLRRLDSSYRDYLIKCVSLKIDYLNLHTW
jgi:hypothetical protein